MLTTPSIHAIPGGECQLNNSRRGHMGPLYLCYTTPTECQWCCTSAKCWHDAAPQLTLTTLIARSTQEGTVQRRTIASRRSEDSSALLSWSWCQTHSPGSPQTQPPLAPWTGRSASRHRRWDTPSPPAVSAATAQWLDWCGYRYMHAASYNVRCSDTVQ